MLMADLLTLSAVGMWVGLTARNPNRATGITVARVLVLPLVAGFVILIGTTLAMYSSGNFEPGWKFLLILWFGIGMIADAVFGVNAWRNLNTTFREVATQRFGSAPPLWRKVLQRGPAQ